MYNNKNIHLIGIGGVSMSGIAIILKDLGANVTGSDSTQSIITDMLVEKGIPVTIGSDKNNILNTEIVIYTSSIKDSDIELSFAKELNKEIFERAVILGRLSKEYTNRICITGTHGKSTTTGLVSNIFLEASLNPTISIGATLPAIKSNIHIGTKENIILETCEYTDSFLNFYPTSAIITNIDNDHLDYFKDLNHIKNSFKKFTNLIPDYGYLIVNNDDENSLDLQIDINCNMITYGINNESNFTAKNININENGFSCYDLYINNSYKCNIILNIRGQHNIYNSLAAIALSSNYVTDFNSIKKGIEKYTGVGRRFEYIGKYNEALIYDDYAHHPTEIKTTLESARNFGNKNTYAIFQGHTYSRTKEHINEFTEILSKFDNIIIAPIYAARENNIYNIKEEDLVTLIKKENNNVLYIDSFDKIIKHLKETVKENDLVITIGAGPINEVANNLKE